ncbi:MAG TPA: molybdate ABC transporter substrate-binding protein [Thermoanaerobaculia bacterium]|nr:molybdate ABC transporter substrate-binding protein [Thermoanaerobaculia bacterium]
MPRALPALLLAILLLAAGPAAAETLNVYAAASLSDALREAAQAWETSGGAKVSFNFAGSNDLARQIEAGAPAQVFVSANREQVERLEKAGRVRPGTAFPLLGNALVVIVPAGGKVQKLTGARDLLQFDRLALADPAGVPAGVYAKEWLEREKLWQQLSSRVVPTLDVRAALAAVAAGNLPAGIVYATDATSSSKVRTVYRVPPEAAPEVRYFAAPVVQKDTNPGAARFLAFLRGPKARAIFVRYGFTPIEEKPEG